MTDGWYDNTACDAGRERSMFIAIEGLDASGKNTQTEKLKEYFSRSSTVHKFDFPKYQSVTGEMVLGHLKGDWDALLSQSGAEKFKDNKPLYHSDVATYLFQCCQITNRLECLPDELWNRDKHDKNVYIADRYNASAYAYGLAFGIDFDWLVKTHRNLPQPDLNILLDISVDESFKRRPERRDNYERNGEMLNNVRKCYNEVFNRLGSKNYAIIDASGSVDVTFQKILEQLSLRNLTPSV